MYEDDGALLEDWITSKDAEAFKTLTKRYSSMVYSTCLRVLGNSTDAEELAQECFLKLAETSTPPRQSLGGWLHALARNTSIDRIRSDVRRERREHAYSMKTNTTFEPSWNDVVPYVDEAIDSLPEELRALLIAHFLEDRTHAEIAAEAGLRRHAVTYRIAKGVEQIRAHLKSKNITVTITSFTALLQANAVTAATPHLTAALGKLALGKIVLSVTGGVYATGVKTVWQSFYAGIQTKGILIPTSLLLAASLALWTVQLRQNNEAPIASSRQFLEAVTETPSSQSAVPIVTAQSLDSGNDAINVVQPESQAASPGLSQFASISGTVSETETEAPLNQALVILVSLDVPNAKPKHIQTGDNGQYRFEKLESGTYTLRAIAMGYPEPTDRETKTISLTEGQIIDEVNFSVLGGLGVKGRIVDPQGLPVKNAMVIALEYSRGNSGMIANNLSSDDGTFELRFGNRSAAVSLFAGTHSAFDGSHEMLASEIQGPFQPTSDRIPEIELVLYDTATISGTVVNGNGQPVANARVNPEHNSHSEVISMWGRAVQTGQDGSFEIAGLPAGSYNLSLVASGTDRFIRALPPNDRVELARGETKTGLQLVLGLGLSISGKIVGEAGTPIVGANIRCEDGYARSKADGTYALTGLTAGQCEITIDHEEYLDASRKYVAAGSSNVDFTLNRRGAVEGRVVDAATGMPIPVFEIMYFPEIYTPFYPNWERALVRQSNEDGAFKISNVRPGRVLVVARAEGYLHSTTEIANAPPGVVISNVLLSLEKGMSIKGKVLSPEGDPVANASVLPSTQQPIQRPTEFTATLTDADGCFLLTGLGGDVTAVTAYHSNYPPASIQVMLVSRDEIEVTIVLQYGGTVEGYVYFDGVPWPDRTVQLYTLPPISTTQTMTTSENGRYRFTNLPIGEAVVSVKVGVESDRDLTGLGSFFQQRTNVWDRLITELDLNYSPGYGSVEGDITFNGGPFNEAQVTLILSTGNGVEQHSRLLDQNDGGHYKFEELTAGSAQLIVRDQQGVQLRKVNFDLQERQAVRRDFELHGGASSEVGISGVDSAKTVIVYEL